MEPLGDDLDELRVSQLMESYVVDIYIGTASTFICGLTLFIFCSSFRFLSKNKMLSLLATGDGLTCISILLMGIEGKKKYEIELNSGLVPKETQWTCALKPYVYLRLLGAVFPTLIVFWLSIERFTGVFMREFYRKHISTRTNFPPVFVACYTLGLLTLAYTIAWLHRHYQIPKGKDCGRKEAFSKTFMTYIYSADALGFILALIINSITLYKLANMYAARKDRFEVKNQLKRIRYMFVISFVSTIAVTIPNGILFSAAWFRPSFEHSNMANISMTTPVYHHKVNFFTYLIDIALWMSIFKCSINLFVYFLMKPEFRYRVYVLLGFLSPEFEEHRANIKLREFYFVEGDTRQPGAVPSLCKIARLTEQAIAAEKALARVRQSDTFREISFGRISADGKKRRGTAPVGNAEVRNGRVMPTRGNLAKTLRTDKY